MVSHVIMYVQVQIPVHQFKVNLGTIRFLLVSFLIKCLDCKSYIAMNNCSIQANAQLVPHNLNKHKSTVSSMYIIVSKPGSWISKFKRGGMATLNKQSHFFSEVVSSKPVEYNSKSYMKSIMQIIFALVNRFRAGIELYLHKLIKNDNRKSVSQNLGLCHRYNYVGK